MTPDSSVPILMGWWGGLLFGLSCRFISTVGWPFRRPVPTTWWSIRIARGRYMLRRLLIELR